MHLLAYYFTGQGGETPQCTVGIKGFDRNQIRDLYCCCVVNTDCIFPLQWCNMADTILRKLNVTLTFAVQHESCCRDNFSLSICTFQGQDKNDRRTVILAFWSRRLETLVLPVTKRRSEFPLFRCKKTFYKLGVQIYGAIDDYESHFSSA